MISRKSWTAAIYLGVTILLGGDGLSAAEPVKKQSDDAKAKRVAEGWKQINEEVFERRLGPNKVEHLAFGPEGLSWAIDKMNQRLELLREEQESYPSEELSQVIDGLTARIAGATSELLKLDQNEVEGMSSMTEAVTGPSCSSICYSATADAYSLTSSQGTGAVAEAKFNSTCGYSGNTYAYAYARATLGTVTTTKSQEDPRTGTNVTSGASASAPGGLDCYSEAYSSVSSPDLGISYYTILDTNYLCQSVTPLNVTMSGPSSANFSTATCSTKTWSASASGGTPPYSYNWYYNGTQVGTGTSYSRSVCYNHADFTIQVTGTDTSSTVQSKSVSQPVDVTYTSPFTVTINGSNYEYFEYLGACRNVTWTSTVSGGTSPYSYQWMIGTTVVGTGSSYTKSVCRSQQPGFTLSLTVTGSNSASATDDHSVSVERGEYDGCGGNPCQ
jgi:hypothetical protein